MATENFIIDVIMSDNEGNQDCSPEIKREVLRSIMLSARRHARQYRITVIAVTTHDEFKKQFETLTEIKERQG